jgi:hypothetical protein
MISNEILRVLSSDKMTENPVNRPKVGDTTSRPVYGFRIVPIAERLKTKGSMAKPTARICVFHVKKLSESWPQHNFLSKKNFQKLLK